VKGDGNLVCRICIRDLPESEFWETAITGGRQKVCKKCSAFVIQTKKAQKEKQPKKQITTITKICRICGQMKEHYLRTSECIDCRRIKFRKKTLTQIMKGDKQNG
jgi:predicted Fe-S protein YdhL (DUF1289 family)